ncbi:hypothetical protein [Chryseobacterium sp. SIMBA_029]|uniref:hypothetical protein n=1 Tax=Chryseobacterium sp. SIMBA_029 TaxID=3085772 RepID=UPI00397BDA57
MAKYKNNDKGSYHSMDFVLTDTLCVQMYEDTWSRKEWKDTPYFALEEKLVRIIVYTELYAEYSHQYYLQLEERWRKEAIIKQQEIEKQEAIEKEQKEVEKLILTAENFYRAQKIESLKSKIFPTSRYKT